jgi:preprotein translocase subunit SecG
MDILSVVLLVFFVIIAIFIIILVLLQNEEGDGLGGLFGGGSSSAFGSRSGNVLTRATTMLGALFLIISLGLALLTRTNITSDNIEAEAVKQNIESDAVHWSEQSSDQQKFEPNIEDIFTEEPQE